MALLLQAIDDDGTIRFDFNDPGGTNNPEGLGTFCWDVNLGSQPVDLGLYDYTDAPGGTATKHRHGLTRCGWAQGFNGLTTPGTADGLRTAIGEMLSVLDGGGVLKYQPTSSAEVRYIDYLGSEDLPAMLRGQQIGVVKVFSQLHDPDGMPISLVRKPFLRGPEIDSGTNKLKNGTLLWVGATANRPGNWTYDTTAGISAETINATAIGPLPNWEGAYEFALASTTTHNLRQDTAVASAAPDEVWTFSFYVKKTAGSSGRARAVLRFLDNANVELGSENLGTLTSLTSSWQRLTVTSGAAPASTNKVRVSMRFENSDANSNTVQLAAAQVEKASSATAFRVGTESTKNDPAATDYPGMVFPIYIHGDAPSAVELDMEGDTSGGSNGANTLLALRSTAADALTDFLNTTKFAQAESLTQGTDTSVITSTTEADFSPGSGNVGSTTTFATATMATRLTATFNTLLSARRGLFDVYVRCRKTVSGDGINVRLKWGLSDTIHTTEPTVALSSVDAFTHLVRLGRIFVPDDVTLANVIAQFQAERTSGSGALRWDYIWFVPTDEQATRLETATDTQRFLTDPDAGTAFSASVSGRVRAVAEVKGGIPFLAPSGLSVATRHIGVESDQSSAIITTASFALTYSPRYLAT